MILAIEGLTTTPCLEFTGPLNKDGYGERRYEKPRLAHRWAIASIGVDKYGTPWNNDLIVMHECDNRRCIRYDHLRLATRLENNRDMFSKGRDGRVGRRKTHCPHGREYDTWVTRPNGSRYQSCKTCARLRFRARYAANPEAHKAAVRRYNEKQGLRHVSGN